MTKRQSLEQMIEGDDVPGLSDALRPIYLRERAIGNRVIRVDRPAGSRCELAVIFERPLQFAGIDSDLDLSADVERWSSRDPRYPLEEGYRCSRSGHAIAGPLS